MCLIHFQKEIARWSPMCYFFFISVKGGGIMNYELSSDKKLAVFWQESGQEFDNRKARSFKRLNERKIVPVIVEAGTQRAEDCLYVLFKVNR